MGKIVLTDKKTPPPRVRNEHIVPRSYLNKFANKEKKFFVYRKDQKPVLKSTKGQSSEIDFFEYTINKNDTNNKHEDWFQKIETSASPVYDALVSNQQLSNEQAVSWAVFVAMLFLRTRKVRDQIGPKLMKQVDAEILATDEQIREMQHHFLKQGQLFSFEELKTIVDDTRKQMNEAPAFGHLAGIEENVRNLAGNILEKQWWPIEAEAGTFFVTSDCPVVTMKLVGNNTVALGNGFGQEDVAVVVPMSPNKTFIASPRNVHWNRVAGKEAVLALNKAVINFADQAVYALEKSDEVQTLVDQEINRVVYGENAFVPRTQ